MKRSAVSSIMLLAGLLSACSISASIAPTDRSEINVGATRTVVEEAVGKPFNSLQVASGTADSYWYNATHSHAGPFSIASY